MMNSLLNDIYGKNVLTVTKNKNGNRIIPNNAVELQEISICLLICWNSCKNQVNIMVAELFIREYNPYIVQKILIFILILSAFYSIAQKTHSVSVEFTGIKSPKGSIRMGLFKTKETFEAEKPFEFFVVSKAGMKNGSITKIFNLPEGEYGISVWDDANDNETFDKTFIGIPKEGYGFGNYIHKSFSKPQFSEFRTKVYSGMKPIQVAFRYIY
jgi:uncharacterized protein (DUF2141 family)